MKTLLPILLTALLSAAAHASAFHPPLLAEATDVPPASTKLETKDVRIRERDDVLNFTVEPEKPEFKVNESIRFKVRGDKRFYLYVLAVDDAGNKTSLLVPSSTQRSNRYDGEEWHLVPNKDFDFASDQAGKQHLVFIASRKSLDVDKTDFRKVGKLPVTDTAKAAAAFASKGIFFTDADAHPEQEAVVTHVNVNVVGSGAAAVDAGGSPAATTPTAASDNASLTFLAVDRAQYKAGDAIVGAYGAMTAGFVHVFVVEPDGKHYALKHGPVSASKPETFKAVAGKPFGAHKLVAVFSEKEAIDEESIDFAPPAARPGATLASKGVSLSGDKRAPNAVVPFTINE